MSEILAGGRPDDTDHGFAPAGPGLRMVNLRAREGLDRHTDAAPPGCGLASLALVHAAAPLQPTMIALDAPSLVLQRFLPPGAIARSLPAQRSTSPYKILYILFIHVNSGAVL